jgi:hypothetical protein
VRQLFAAQDNDPVVNTPEEFGRIISSEADKWGGIGRKLGVKLD